jgi:hypothetical protein
MKTGALEKNEIVSPSGGASPRPIDVPTRIWPRAPTLMRSATGAIATEIKISDDHF